MFWSMGVRAKCQDFSSQLPVACQYLFCRVGMSQAIFEACGVAFQPYLFFYERFQNGVQDILIFFVGIILVLIWTVAYNIIDMAAGVKAGKSLQIFQEHFKIAVISLIFAPFFKKCPVIRI